MIFLGNASILPAVQTGDTAVNLKAKSQEAADSDFKSVFDKSVSDAAKRTSSNETPRNDREEAGNPDAKLRFKSFREVRANQTVAAKQTSPAKDIDAEEVSGDAEKESKVFDKGYDEQINILAQMLGISAEQLAKLAEKLGFSKESLKDANQLNAFVDKLSNYLQLDDPQKNVLMNLVQEVSKQVKPEEVKIEVKLPENAEKSDTEVKITDLSKLADEVKAKLDSFISNGRTDSESIRAELSKVLAAMKGQNPGAVITEAEVQSGLDSQKTVDELPVDEKLEVKDPVKTKEDHEDLKEETASDKTNAVSEAAKEPARASTGNDPDLQQNLQTPGEIKLPVANSQVSAEKVKFTMPQPVKSSDIINQVVEQAKVVLGNDKSEMVIHMKPDHLGKLELKIVTEQGIVAAKFIAENQQVKDVIETNMQLLKDSLQKQGISIEGVSVQVGQDKKNGFMQQHSFEGKSGNSGSRRSYGSSIAGVSKAGISSLETLPERLAQYAYDSSTINLTA